MERKKSITRYSYWVSEEGLIFLLSGWWWWNCHIFCSLYCGRKKCWIGVIGEGLLALSCCWRTVWPSTMHCFFLALVSHLWNMGKRPLASLTSRGALRVTCHVVNEHRQCSQSLAIERVTTATASHWQSLAIEGVMAATGSCTEAKHVTPLVVRNCLFSG